MAHQRGAVGELPAISIPNDLHAEQPLAHRADTLSGEYSSRKASDHAAAEGNQRSSTEAATRIRSRAISGPRMTATAITRSMDTATPHDVAREPGNERDETTIQGSEEEPRSEPTLSIL